MKKSFLKKCLLVASLAFVVNSNTTAQVTYPYVADFETATTNPSSKSYASTDPITINGMQWEMGGVYLGSMLNNDKYNGEKAARLRLTNNSSGEPGYIQSLENFPNGIGTASFFIAAYGTQVNDTIGVYTSTDEGANWTLQGSVVTSETLVQHSFDINQGGNVRFKIQKLTTNNKRSNIDDINITSSGAPTSLSLTAKTPLGDGIALTEDSLTIKFNNKIQKIAGTIAVFKSGTTAPAQSFSVQSDAVTISTNNDSTAIINGLNLENNTTYYVKMGFGCFAQSDNPTITSLAIDDTINWRFTTVDTTPLPPPPIYTTLEETFSTCDNNGGMGLYKAVNITGTNKRWVCSSYGHNDSFAVYMNGGSAPNVSEASHDLLVSYGKYDFSAMTNPTLTFYHKRRYEGNVTLKVKISTDYDGYQNPTQATWNDIHTINTPSVEDAWEVVSDINLTDYKATPFYIAFSYECGTDGAFAYSIDDLKVEEGTTSSINETNTQKEHLQVLGTARRTRIDLSFSTQKQGLHNIQLFNINGQVVYSKARHLTTGSQTLQINDINLTTGMYFIKITNGTGQSQVTKVPIQ